MDNWHKGCWVIRTVWNVVTCCLASAHRSCCAHRLNDRGGYGRFSSKNLATRDYLCEQARAAIAPLLWWRVARSCFYFVRSCKLWPEEGSCDSLCCLVGLGLCTVVMLFVWFYKSIFFSQFHNGNCKKEKNSAYCGKSERSDLESSFIFYFIDSATIANFLKSIVYWKDMLIKNLTNVTVSKKVRSKVIWDWRWCDRLQ